jgi:Flp pilus assembly protein TadG
MFRNEYEGHLDRGAAAVEMALVLPMLLLVLFGIIDFGRAFDTQMQLTQAALEAVRFKALGGTDADATSRALSATGGLASPAPTITFPLTCPAGNATANAKVTVSYSFQFITPLGPMASFFGASTLPGIGTVRTLSSSGVMRCAG